MKIAVNYENGQIFQHFGQTKTFKVYTVENNAVTGTELVPGAPEGHHALGRQLIDQLINLVLGSYVDSLGRLIQNQHLRIHGKDTGNRNSLLLSAAQS